MPGAEQKAPLPRHLAMTWAQRLARVFSIDVTRCERCGGALKMIACLERAGSPEIALPPPRAPP